MIKYLLTFLILLATPAYADSMSVEEAYGAIPHRKTDFQNHDSKLDHASKAYLSEMFDLVNGAIVQRVQTLRWFASRGERGSSYEEYRANIEDIQEAMKRLEAPDSLANVKALVLQSIHEQSEYFRKLDVSAGEGEPFRFNRGDPLVVSSHRKLIAAYNQLMKTFPFENRNNKQAFFDHLCALDFI